MGEGKAETVSCRTLPLCVGDAGKPPRPPPLLPSDKTKDEHGSTSFCLVVVGPGVKGVIGNAQVQHFLPFSDSKAAEQGGGGRVC